LGAGIAYLVAGLTPRQAMCFFTGSTIKTVDDHCGYALPWDPLQRLTSNNAGYHDVHHQSWGIKTNFSQPFFTFWDRLLGTQWAGGDVSARYERARLAAERRLQQDGLNSTYTSSITTSKASMLEGKAPYAQDIPTASDIARSAQTTAFPIPEGKAAAQAAGSREMILADQAYGGINVLAEEAEEERTELLKAPEPQPLRRSPRKKTLTSTPAAQAGSLKGLRDRVSTTTGFHGRTGAVLGYESSR
jgi:sphinganine C4-monooxygenase